jgi:hypothetical protein
MKTKRTIINAKATDPSKDDKENQAKNKHTLGLLIRISFRLQLPRQQLHVTPS